MAKRPAAKVAKPATGKQLVGEPVARVAIKRPAAAIAGAATKLGKSIPVSFKPTEYKGGKIYFSKAKRAWRVYLRKRDRVESTVKVDTKDKADVDARWSKCLKIIRHDKRPIEP